MEGLLPNVDNEMSEKLEKELCAAKSEFFIV
jgi:hypothetical protein